MLGNVPELGGWHSVAEHPSATQLPDVVVFRWEAPLFFASNAKTVRNARQKRYLFSGLLICQPITCRLETETLPDSELSVNQEMRRKTQSVKNCAASVATAR